MKSIIEEYGSYEALPIEHKVEILKLRLANTDYQALKYAEGELTEEEYAPIKAQRKAWREEINRLEKTVKINYKSSKEVNSNGN